MSSLMKILKNSTDVSVFPEAWIRVFILLNPCSLTPSLLPAWNHLINSPSFPERGTRMRVCFLTEEFQHYSTYLQNPMLQLYVTRLKMAKYYLSERALRFPFEIESICGCD